MGLRPPLPGEYDERFAPYLAVPCEGDVLALLQTQVAEAADLFTTLSDAQALHRYAPGKWSLKDLLQHITDTERIFAYRCLRIGRGDSTPLAGFDENAFAALALADECPMPVLLTDFRAARNASLTLFGSLPDAAWSRQGSANGRAVTTRCIPYLCLGHAAHHLAIVRERYLPGLK